MRHFIYLFFLISYSISFAQNHRFGRVSIEELEKKEMWLDIVIMLNKKMI